MDRADLLKLTLLSVFGLAIVALLAVRLVQDQRRLHRPLLTTPYQAVTLVDGGVRYGRIDHLGSDHPVLRDAFTVSHETDPATQRAKLTMRRLRDGPTGADHLIFPVSAIVSVEPVASDSPVGTLIASTRLR